MNLDIIYNKWTNFINDSKYSQYFEKNNQNWINIFYKLSSYIKIMNKIPSKYDDDKKICNLRLWFNNQQYNFNNKIKIMINEIMYNKWKNFIDDLNYKKYDLVDEDTMWINIFNKLILYINTNKEKPSKYDTELFDWFNKQLYNYKNKIEIMKNEKIYNIWTNFINDPNYKECFLCEYKNIIIINKRTLSETINFEFDDNYYNDSDNICDDSDNFCDDSDNICDDSDNFCDDFDNICDDFDNICDDFDNICDDFDNVCDDYDNYEYGNEITNNKCNNFDNNHNDFDNNSKHKKKRLNNI